MSDKFSRLREYMDETMEKTGLPGIDCIIYQDHKEIFRHAAGYMDIENKIPPAPGALYNIYSATKVITCVAAMQLVEQGRLLLIDPVHKYLPEFEHMQVKYGTWALKPAASPILVVDLFRMTAGISYDADTPHLKKLKDDTNGVYTTREFVQALAKEPLMFNPGQGYNYGFCHEVIGAIIEVVSGKSFGEYLKENIFDPLGMKDSGFIVPEEKKSRIAPQYYYNEATNTVTKIDIKSLAANNSDKYESGGGGLIMPAEDYILFGDALACGGVGANGARIISKNSISLMAKNQLKGKPLEDFINSGSIEGYGYGLGFGVVYDQAAALSLRPEGVFSWGGIGGVQNVIDPINRLSYYVSRHLVLGPKDGVGPYMLNILYSLM
ncbi:MAG: beta-lactamase family protein [Defluviitaleaceae bacterium]|nr:beta-lactamase family protein [Defluviitaleaceae bacterium]